MFERTREWIANRMGYSTKEAPSGSKRDPKKIAVKRIGNALGTSSGNFETPAVDLNEMTKAYNTDSYVRRAVDKYSELIFKEGWEIAGKDEAITLYIWTRLKLMSEGTGQPIEELLKDIAQDLVLYGNAFVVKARQKGGTGGASGIKAVGYTGTAPIAGYFVQPPTTIKIKRDPQGKLIGYEQDAGGGNKIEIKPEDMIHFYYKKPRGRAFGMPYLLPALDDVKILRNMEENVARLIYRNLFPLYQYKVGIDKPGYEATDEEIDAIREQIRDMPMDGGLVVPERHDITVVSSSGASLEVSEHLKFFRQRVFTGLGVSDIVMGIGNTANRSTADNLTSEMIDGVKDYQAVFKNTIVSRLINELLFEGGYDPIMNEEHEVDFIFAEIELDAKIKKENHFVQLFTQNAISHEELRLGLGKDPIMDEARLYFNMVTIPVAVQTAQASADASATAANNAGSNKDQPANKTGKKLSPGKPKASLEDPEKEELSTNLLTEASVKVNLHSELRISHTTEYLNKLWNSFRDDVISMIQLNRSKEQIEAFVIHLVKQTMRSQIEKDISNAFYVGIADGKDAFTSENLPSSIYFELDKLKKLSVVYTDRLSKDMKDLIFKALGEELNDDKILKASGAFESNAYRLNFISKTEPYRAYNYAVALVAKEAKLKEVKLLGPEECALCQEKLSQPLDLTQASLLDAVPPFHPNCTCTIDLKTPVEEV